MNFDTPAERKGTNSIKWDSQAIANIASNPEAEPFWVADMDFLPEAHIKKAGMALSDLGVYGYPAFHSRLEDAAAGWLGKKHGWNVDSGALTFAMGMLHGIASVLDLFTEPGDKVLVPSPMYRPFREIVQNNRRSLVEFPLSYVNGSFLLDKERFSSAMDGVRCILFCSPQNPSGIVFTHDELSFVLEEAARHDALVISDEIHSDLVHPGAMHIPMGKANEDIGARCATFFAPSKTFNIAGEHCSFVHFSDDMMKNEFRAREEAMRLTEPSILIGDLTIAAYEHGLEYNRELCAYLGKSMDAIKAWLQENCPEIKAANGNASFVTFLDLSEYYGRIEKEVLSNPEKYEGGQGGGVLSRFFGVRASVAMNDGTWFGSDWKEFVRFNYGTSRERALAALSRIVDAVRSL